MKQSSVYRRRDWVGRMIQWICCLLVMGVAAEVRAQQAGQLADGRMPMPLVSGDRVLVLGDSITQDGRYVDLVTAYLWAKYPELEVDIFNAGLSSETVSGITEPVHPFPRPNVQDRLERALAITQPDWVLICYGMNDGIYHPTEPRIKEMYQVGMERVLAKVHQAGARAILLAPPVFDAKAPAVVERLAKVDPDEPYGYLRPFEEYDKTLVALTNIARSFERDRRVERFIDLHVAMFDFLNAAKRADPEFAYGDGVHPPLAGHAAMATAILFGLGESEEDAQRVIAKVAGLRPPGMSAEDLPAATNADDLRRALFKRGDQVNALLREATNPKTSAERSEMLGQQTTELLRESRGELRPQIETAWKE